MSETRMPYGDRQIVDDKGRSVKRSIPTIDVARSVMKSMEDAENAVAVRHSRYQGQVNRNPPFDSEKLKSLNLGYKCNVNFGEAAAIVKQRAGQHFELFNEVPNLVEFHSVDHLDEKGVQPRTRWEEVVAEEFTTTLKEWTGFLPLMVFLRGEADVNDVGVCAWRDEWDWRPVPMHRGAFFPSPYARVDVDTWDLCGLADTYDAFTLIELAEDPEASQAEGWNPEQIKRLLVDIFVGGLAQDTANGVDTGYAVVNRWEQLQAMIRNNDPTCMSRMFEPIKVRHLFAKEPRSKKISHLIMPTAICSEGDGFLCERYDRYDRMSQAIFVLPSDYGNGYLRGVRGIVADIEAHCDLSNRFLCDIFDAGRLSGTIMLKNLAGTSDPRRLQLVRAGVVTLLPPGTEALQASSFAPPLNNLVMVRDLSSAIMRNNTGVFRQMPETWAENQPQKTARQVAEEVSKEARLEKANVAFDYAQLQLLYREMFRRMISPEVQSDKTLPGAEEAQAFVQRCLDREVPEELLKPGKLRLMIMQAIGVGSWGVRLDVTNQLVGMRPLLDEAGSRNAIRDRIAALVGQRNVDRYLAPTTRDDIPSNESSIATLENTDMMQGQAAVVGADQNHFIHILTHLEPLQGIVQTVAEKGAESVDPQRALGALEQLLPHVVAHLQILGEDPARAEFVKQIESVVKSGIEVRDMLAREMEKILAAQQKEQEEQQRRLMEAEGVIQDREHEIDLMKAQAKIGMEQQKQATIVQMRAQKASESAMINRQRAEADIGLRVAKSNAEISIDQQLANAKIELARLEAAAKKVRVKP